MTITLCFCHNHFLLAIHDSTYNSVICSIVVKPKTGFYFINI